jgi:hypothetical protein
MVLIQYFLPSLPQVVVRVVVLKLRGQQVVQAVVVVNKVRTQVVVLVQQIKVMQVVMVQVVMQAVAVAVQAQLEVIALHQTLAVLVVMA